MLANQFQEISSNENFSNGLKRNFQSVYYQLHQQIINCTYQKMEFNDPFNITALEDALANSNNCAVARDKLHCEILKHMPVYCLQILLLLFNRIWFTDEIPPEWTHSTVIPLHKPNKHVNAP